MKNFKFWFLVVLFLRGEYFEGFKNKKKKIESISCVGGLPVEWHSFSIFVPENEQDVVTGNGRFQVTSQLGRVTDYHFRVDKWH